MSRYLNGQIPFVYLGIPVGANFRRAETWKPVPSRQNLKETGFMET